MKRRTRRDGGGGVGGGGVLNEKRRLQIYKLLCEKWHALRKLERCIVTFFSKYNSVWL